MDNQIDHKPEKKTYPSLGQAFGLIGILVLISIAVAIPAEFVKDSISPDFKSLVNGIAYVLSMLILLAFGIKMRKSITFHWKKVPLQILILSIPLVISFGVLIEPLINAIPMPEQIKEFFNNILTNDIYSILTIAIAAPLLEEIVFRGIVLQGFLKRYSPVKAIFWSAVIFGTVHLNPWQFIPAFSLGLIIGWLYWKTGSLIPGIVVHFINNSFAFLILLLTNDNFVTTQQIMGEGKSYYIFYGMCIPIFIGSVLLIHQRFKFKEA